MEYAADVCVAHQVAAVGCKRGFGTGGKNWGKRGRVRISTHAAPTTPLGRWIGCPFGGPIRGCHTSRRTHSGVHEKAKANPKTQPASVGQRRDTRSACPAHPQAHKAPQTTPTDSATATPTATATPIAQKTTAKPQPKMPFRHIGIAQAAPKSIAKVCECTPRDTAPGTTQALFFHTRHPHRPARSGLTFFCKRRSQLELRSLGA